MLADLHRNKGIQALLGLLFGIVFGFLLQKGGVTDYNVIIGQSAAHRFHCAEGDAIGGHRRDDRVSVP